MTGGAVTIIAILAGIKGAGLSLGVSIVLGVDNITDDGCVMAVKNCTWTKAERGERNGIYLIGGRIHPG